MVYYAKIGKKTYPLVFSLGVRKQINNIYGSLKALKDFAAKKETSDDEKIKANSSAIDCITTLAEIMIKQGVAYKNKFEKEYRTRDGDAVDDRGIWHSISKEDIELIISDDEFNSLSKIVFEAIGNSSGAIQTKPKNRKATQGKK